MKAFHFLFSITLFICLQACQERPVQFHEQCDQQPKYYDTFQLPENLIGYNNYDQALHCSRIVNKPLAVYFTATACANCPTFESTFLSDPEIAQILNEKFVFVSLNADDRTELPKEDQFIYRDTLRRRDRKIKTIGQLSLINLYKFRHGAQPCLFLTNLQDSIIAWITYDSNSNRLKSEFKSSLYH